MPEQQNPFSQMTASELGTAIGDTNNRTEASQIREVVEKRAEMPTHEELMKDYEAARMGEKLNQSRATLERMMRDAGIENLGDAQWVEDGEIDLKSLDVSDKPQIFFKQVKVGKKSTELTNQVVIVAVNKTSERPDENTVVYAIVDQNKGVPKIGSGPGLYRTLSQEDYNEIHERDPPDHQTRLINGKSTRQDYLREYNKANGRTLHEHWNQWDKERDNDPRYWNTERLRAGNLERLEGRYNNLLQAAEEKYSEIVKVSYEKGVRTRERNQKILDSDYMGWLVEAVDVGINVERYKRILKEMFNLTDEEVTKYLARKGIAA